MSTITLPGFMLCTISAVISLGAGLPGISAGGDDDVCVLGLGGVHLALRDLEALAHDLGVAAAARALFFVIDLDELAAQRLTWSATSARVSLARTMAPRLAAVPMAARPAAGAGNEHLGRRHAPAGRDLAIEIAAKAFAASITAR